VADGLDVVAVRIVYVGRVVALVIVRAQSGSPVVLPIAAIAASWNASTVA